MASATLGTGPQPARYWASIGVIVLGVLVNAIPAIAIDEVFHRLEVYPAWGEPMFDPSDNLLAFSYRLLLAVASGWAVARLAPRLPMRHAFVLGCVGVVLSTLGTFAMAGYGPSWYPLALVAISLPASLLGARIALRRASAAT